MSILNVLLSTRSMGEPQRLDYAIAENEKLRARVDRLVELLVAKGVVTKEEEATLFADGNPRAEGSPSTS